MLINAVNLDRYRMAHLLLCEAELPPSTARVGHELLAKADLNTGQVNMTWERLAVMTGCENVNAARRHLSRLQGAGLIHYSTNEYVYVTWRVWLDLSECDCGGCTACRNRNQTKDIDEDIEGARQRAGSGAPTRSLDEEVDHESELFGEADAPVLARGRAGRRDGALVAARGRAAYSHARMSVSQSVPLDPPGRTDELTDKLRQRPEIAVDLEEQRRSVKLLTDAEVGVDPAMAWKLAKRWRFEELARQVMTWRRQLQGGLVSGSGALVHRVVYGFGATVTDEDRRSALYRRHYPDWAQEDGQRRSYRVEM